MMRGSPSRRIHFARVRPENSPPSATRCAISFSILELMPFSLITPTSFRPSDLSDTHQKFTQMTRQSTATLALLIGIRSQGDHDFYKTTGSTRTHPAVYDRAQRRVGMGRARAGRERHADQHDSRLASRRSDNGVVRAKSVGPAE